MTAISTRAVTWRAHIESYEEAKLRYDYGEDVRSFAEVLTENYGYEGFGWRFVKKDAAATTGRILVNASVETASPAAFE